MLFTDLIYRHFFNNGVLTAQGAADLYANRAVKVLAWIRGDLPSELSLRVTTTAGERDYAVRLPPRQRPGVP